MNCCSLWLHSHEEVVGNNKSFALLSLSLNVERSDLPTGTLRCCQYNTLALFEGNTQGKKSVCKTDPGEKLYTMRDLYMADGLHALFHLTVTLPVLPNGASTRRLLQRLNLEN